jgi:hypothetical protein
VLIAFTLPNGDVLDVDLTHQQVRDLITRLEEALALGPQVGAPN